MYIDELKIEVLDTYFDKKKQQQSKDTKIVSAIKITEGMTSKSLGKFLDDISDHYEFRGGSTKVMITIDKSEEQWKRQNLKKDISSI